MTTRSRTINRNAAEKKIRNAKVKAAAKKPELPSIVTPEGRTDLANAERFLVEHGTIVRYCHLWREWLVWDGRRWKRDDRGRIRELAKRTAKKLGKIAWQSESTPAMKHAMDTLGRAGMSAMLSLAESSVPITLDQLDQPKHLLNVANGTIDLRTGELLPPRKQAYLTRLCDVEYDPQAKAELWHKCLSEWLSEDAVSYVQRYLGYCATGEISERVILFAIGDGNNGKDTLFQAVMDTLGPDYSEPGPETLLMDLQYKSHDYNVADLCGKRLVICSETDEGQKLDSAFVKKITGGGMLKGREPYGRKPFAFVPTHKLVLMTNNEPAARGDDEALFNRLHLLPFERRFLGKHCDKKLPAKLERERAGILAWIVEGARQWYEHGLLKPKTVADATREYRRSCDPIGQFVEARCNTGQKLVVAFSTLYEQLDRWCAANHQACPSTTAAGKWFKRHFRRDTNAANNVIYWGVTLKSHF